MAKALYLVEKAQSDGETMVHGLRSMIINNDDGDDAATICANAAAQATVGGFPIESGYFGTATQIDDLTSGPLKDDQDCYLVFLTGVVKVEGT
jgi:hypothetical protein